MRVVERETKVGVVMTVSYGGEEGGGGGGEAAWNSSYPRIHILFIITD